MTYLVINIIFVFYLNISYFLKNHEGEYHCNANYFFAAHLLYTIVRKLLSGIK